ncbi:MAG: hypothetical protein IPN94_24875 [Sphingobacteriales bacterium]|nr:hypothetical protein [Sphingobacteriales bacterium]
MLLILPEQPTTGIDYPVKMVSRVFVYGVAASPLPASTWYWASKVHSSP